MINIITSNNNYSNSMCIVEQSLVRVYENNNDTYIPVEQIRKGTCIINDNNSAFVKCVIKTKYSGLVCINNNINNNNIIKITPFHPILINNEWIFPIDCNLFETEHVNDVYVYNFFLENYNNFHQIELYGGIIACSLNHGMQGPVIGHDYFGTNRVQYDFEKHPDWENGYIHIEHIKIFRENNKVISIDF